MLSQWIKFKANFLRLCFWFLAPASVLCPALHGLFPAMELELLLNAFRFHTFVHWGD